MTTVLFADAMLTPAGEIEDAELEIDARGRIAYAGKRRAASSPHAASDGNGDASRTVLDLAGHALMPGLVNGHTHSAMTLQRGICDDEGFMPWLAAVQSLEQELTRDDIVVGLELAMLEMIETGTTAFADMYHWDLGLLETVKAAGMRVLAAPAMFTSEAVGWPGVSPLNGTETLDETEALAAHFAGDEQIKLAYGPHAPYTCPPELLREIRDRAVRTGIPIHIHVSESLAEIEQITGQYGATPGVHLDSLGFFDASVLCAHCVHLTDEEIALFVRTGTAASHNPMSNLKLGCGVARLPEMLAAGMRLTLGTDSVASNNSLDLFEEIKLATVLHRGVRHDAAAVLAADVLDIATRRGAEAIGFEDAGALEAGRLADVVAVDLGGTRATPRGSLVSQLAFSTNGSDVRHVFIGGRHVYADGRHLTLDAEGIRARARAAAARLR